MAKTTIVQTSFNSGELSPYMDARVDQSRYLSGCRTLRNMLLAPHGAAYRRPGFRYMGDALDSSGAGVQRRVRLIPFVFNEEQSYVLEFSEKKMRVWFQGGLVLGTDGQPLEVTVPFGAAHLWDIRHCQSADVMYMVCPDLPPQRLERRGHANWSIAAINFSPAVSPPSDVVAAATLEKEEAASRSYSYVITSIGADTEEESLPSPEALCNAAKTLSTSNYVTIAWQTVPEAREYRIYRAGGGTGSYGFLGRSTEGRYVDRGQEADFSHGLPEARTPFEGEGNYPSCIQFYQQRLCFAGSRNGPQTVWASRTANYQNMNISRPLQADDACTITIAADRVNAVRWMMSAHKLLIGTVDSEWTLSGQGGEVFSPTSCSVERQGARGSASLPALAVGDAILFVQRGANVVREFRYSLDSDGYSGVDLSIISEHILRHRRIVDWAWQQNPHSVLWCVLDDGTLAGLTLIREHEIVAWHRHETQGFAEAVTVIPGEKGDDIWVVTSREREVDGKNISMRCIERLDPIFEGDDAVEAFFVDSGLSWRGEPVTELSALEHLEGREVQILADGWVHPPQVVQKGRISLEHKASVVHVGLGFQSDIAPMASEPSEAQGTALGMTRRVGRVRFRLYRTLGCKIGPDADHLRDVLSRKVQHPLGTALPLFSGDRSALIDAVVATSGGVFFRQDDPLPFTLLSVAHEVEVGEV